MTQDPARGNTPSAPTTGRQWYEHARACQQAGDLISALDAYRASLKLNPRAAAAWIGMAEVLDLNQQPLDALACLQRGVQADPRSVVAATRLGRSLQGLGRVDDARRAFDHALGLDPASVSARMGLGELLEDQGDPEGAAAAYRTILDQNPERSEPLANLLGLGRYIDIKGELELAQQRLQSAANRDRALIGYGLGKALDRMQETDAAFAALAVANEARRAEAGPFDRKVFDARIDRLIDIFSPDFFAQRKGWGNGSSKPVFIVGLPRSGTTLTEQIIGSHPQCFGAGELGILADLATGAPDRLGRPDPPWPHCAPELSQQQVQELGSDFVEQLQRRAQGEPRRIVDKQPLNFWHLGLVALALPGARILHCRRDLRDNGFSIYSQNFNPSQRWSADLGDIAHYWRGYRRLMAHWEAVTGLAMLSVDYEDTVAELTPQAERLLTFLNLPWDPAVLDFHRNERAVQTPSRWQVRQPIYRDSAAKWRRYEAYLTPLGDAMAETDE
ncbi:MAG: sulfotransferase [Pseudomonadota bacterium]